jgi:hypothetical protein
MARPGRVKAVCAAMMILYLAVAAGRLAASALPLIDPMLTTAKVHCSFTGCRVETDPFRLIPGRDSASRAKWASRGAQLEAHVRGPGVRAWMFAAEAIRGLPLVFLFLSLALASRALARTGSFGETIGWLRRAAAAALAGVAAQPIADSISATALSPVLLGRDQVHLHLVFNGGPFLWGVLLAGAVWMSVWALEQARLNEIELGTIV